jgi:ABC-2 type transport system permease protein
MTIEPIEGATGPRAVYVADADLMLPVFLQLRADPNQVQEMKFQFQNVTFLLNTIDWLTGEYEFLEIRKHEPTFSSLKLVESVRQLATDRERDAEKQFQEEYDEAIRELDEKNATELAKLQERIDDMEKKKQKGEFDRGEFQSRLQEFRIKEEALTQAKTVQTEKYQREMNNSIQSIRRAADMDVVQIQNSVKALAVTLPCIPPLLVGIGVFAYRRLRERDTIVKSRLK